MLEFKIPHVKSYEFKILKLLLSTTEFLNMLFELAPLGSMFFLVPLYAGSGTTVFSSNFIVSLAS